ncbi:unnamed protein product, partial [Musa textilis]
MRQMRWGSLGPNCRQNKDRQDLVAKGAAEIVFVMLRQQLQDTREAKINVQIAYFMIFGDHGCTTSWRKFSFEFTMFCKHIYTYIRIYVYICICIVVGSLGFNT